MPKDGTAVDYRIFKISEKVDKILGIKPREENSSQCKCCHCGR